MVFPTFVCSRTVRNRKHSGTVLRAPRVLGQGLEALIGFGIPPRLLSQAVRAELVVPMLSPQPYDQQSWSSPPPSCIKAVPVPSTIHRRLLALSEQILLIALDAQHVLTAPGLN